MLAERPDDPEALLLSALIYAHQGNVRAGQTDLARARKASLDEELSALANEIAALLDRHPGQEGAEKPGGCVRVVGLGLLAIVAVVLVKMAIVWVMEFLGDEVAEGLDLRGPSDDGHSLLGLMIVVGAGLLLGLLWKAIKAERYGPGARTAFLQHRDLARTTAASLDEQNVRLQAAQFATFLPGLPILMLTPTVLIGAENDPTLIIRVWSILVASGLAGWMCWWSGLGQIRRAFKLSRPLTFHTIAAGVWTILFVVWPYQLTRLDSSPYIFGWFLGCFIVMPAYINVVFRRLRREGRLQVLPYKERRRRRQTPKLDQ
ncbi:hypothetical protein ACFLIM_42640 [Nonomuraea sp. M3C6]|uniref:Tetratricopeptide repeat-containing protein n=1 Tax=Nonomuraea marmarensis TaxID=3351344 RepID=A0ABW7AUW5_9ACTN